MDFVYVVSEAESLMCIVVSGGEGTFEPTTLMLSRESRTNPLTWEVMCVYPTSRFLK